MSSTNKNNLTFFSYLYSFNFLQLSFLQLVQLALVWSYSFLILVTLLWDFLHLGYCCLRICYINLCYKICPLQFYFLSDFFSWSDFECCQTFSWIYWDNQVTFKSIYSGYYNYWCPYTETRLNLWDNPILILVVSAFDIWFRLLVFYWGLLGQVHQWHQSRDFDFVFLLVVGIFPVLVLL